MFTLENHLYDIMRIFLLGEITGININVENWDKFEQQYRKLEKKNPQIKKLTKELENNLHDLLVYDINEGGLIPKYFKDKYSSETIESLKPLLLEELNKNAFRKMNENKIKRFSEFSKINESVDLFKIDLNKLLNSREGIDYFFELVKKEGMSVRQTTTHGYQIEANGNHLDLLNHWRDNYGLEYDVDKVTNKEHPDYGKYFYSINIFRNPRKIIDTSNIMKQINK